VHRWRFALPPFSGQVLWLTRTLVAQLLLLAGLTQPMRRWYISIESNSMALLHKCCWHVGADIARIWSITITIFRTGFCSCYDCICDNFSHKGNSTRLDFCSYTFSNLKLQLLLSVPGFLRADLEVLAINSISDASETFEKQCAAQKTGCAMQARFLKKVIDNYQTMKAQAQAQAQSQSHKLPSHPHHNKSEQHPDYDKTKSTHNTLNMTRQSPGWNESDMIPTEGGVDQEAEQIRNESLVVGNYAFSDNEMWENMFAEAGFRLNDGVFMPEAMG